jgi:hypothetical protein
VLAGTIVGSEPPAVFRSVYTEVNARLQAQAMARGGPVTYLDPEEAKKAQASVAGTIQRPWDLWKTQSPRAIGGRPTQFLALAQALQG